MIRMPSYDNFGPFINSINTNRKTQKRQMTPVKKKSLSPFEDIFENFTMLPTYENSYNPVHWMHLNNIPGCTIFPEKFISDNFNQGSTGLCFLFASLSSIATIPGLIHKIF